MTDIICPKCGSVNDYYTELKSNNNVARCNKCDAFIKNLPHADPVMYVGKYKDKKISEIEDLGYLIWAKKNMVTVGKNIRDAIQKQIDKLEHLAK